MFYYKKKKIFLNFKNFTEANFICSLSLTLFISNYLSNESKEFEKTFSEKREILDKYFRQMFNYWWNLKHFSYIKQIYLLILIIKIKKKIISNYET